MAQIEIVETVAENEEKLDLLNRQEFVDKMADITEILSKKHKNVCYALNGTWGVGKSFVLDMFEEKIGEIQYEETSNNKYFLFRYNCWKYDYYEEPLIAIVSSMLDQIDEKENLFSTETKTRLKSALKVIGNGLVSKVSQVVEDKTGVNVEELINAIKESNEEALKEMEKENEYDSYFTFKKTLKALSETIKCLAKEKTLVFVVDELDRCLPEYAIKVLERLHHIFDDIPNVQMIISIDKKQFKHTIKKIYGEETDVDKYLAKFIDFEMALDEGYLNDEFDKRFSHYVNKFDYLNSATTITDIYEFKKNIFNGIDMRRKIEIIEKCDLLHDLLNKDEEIVDFSFMCIELTFVVLMYWGIDLFNENQRFRISNVFNVKSIDEHRYTGIGFLNDKLQDKDNGILYYAENVGSFGYKYNFVRRSDIWGVILSSYRYVIGHTKDSFSDSDGYHHFGLRNYSNEFRNLLYTIS